VGFGVGFGVGVAVGTAVGFGVGDTVGFMVGKGVAVGVAGGGTAGVAVGRTETSVLLPVDGATGGAIVSEISGSTVDNAEVASVMSPEDWPVEPAKEDSVAESATSVVTFRSFSERKGNFCMSEKN